MAKMGINEWHSTREREREFECLPLNHGAAMDYCCRILCRH
jgi:hypothetical protein